ncbi:MAG: glycosyltransferase [Candidatus Wukongarchaeota archaeon]|nr:glycosyltransferase [Candidatus Wukongarchaeota archaeon]
MGMWKARMRISKVDVIICTKDRSHFLKKAVEQARMFIPTNDVIVVESSVSPNKKLLKGLNVETVFTPNVKLGYARQQGLLKAKTKYVVFLDDDLEIEKNWFYPLFKALISDSKVLAVSSQVVYRSELDSVLTKVYYASPTIPKFWRKRQGGSAGASLMERQKILDIGGYNVNVHRGEDTELFFRLQRKGLKWIRVTDSVAYHPITLKEQLYRSCRNGRAIAEVWKLGLDMHLLKIVIRLTRRVFVAPIILMFTRKDPRVLVYHAVIQFVILASFLRKMMKNEVS